MTDLFTINMLNPGPRPRKRGRVAKKKSSKKHAKKHAKKSRPSPAKKEAPTVAKKRSSKKHSKKSRKSHHRSYSAKSVGHKTKKRRKHNPARRFGGGGSLMSAGKSLGVMALGMLAVSALTKRLPAATDMGAGPSSIAGERWSMAQYGGALAIALIAPKFVGKFVDPTAFRNGALGLIAGKVVFTEILPKVPGASRFLGADPDGSVKVDDVTGQAYIMANGTWQALQGLVHENRMDGLVHENRMDGRDGDFLTLEGETVDTKGADIMDRSRNPILRAYA